MFDGKLSMDLSTLTDSEKDLLIEYKEELMKYNEERAKERSKQKENIKNRLPVRR